MISIGLILDVVKLVAGIGLAYFVIYLYEKVFRSGVMEQGFRIIAVSMIILVISRVLAVVSDIQPNNAISMLSSPVIGIAFSLVATYGFYLLYKVWRVDKKEPLIEKRPIVT